MDVPQPDCGQVQAALSAASDGEDPGLVAAVVQAHLQACDRCRRFQEALSRGGLDVAGLSAPALASVPVDQPSLASRITAAAGAEDRAGVWTALRVLLGFVAVGYLVTAVPELLFADDPHHAHVARHLGAFESAYGVALLFVAIRPAKARAMVPFTVALAVVMGLAVGVDLANGAAFWLTELAHVLEVAGLVLVWLLATRRGWPPRRRERRGHPPLPPDPAEESEGGTVAILRSGVVPVPLSDPS